MVECTDGQCHRKSWNGESGQHCCRTCKASSGVEHDLVCNSRAAPCKTAGCPRKSWNGAPGQCCCRTCGASSCKDHGPRCTQLFKKLCGCSTGSCSRQTWNGKPGSHCCRTCKDTGGRAHGPICLHRFAVSLGWDSWPWHAMPLTEHLKGVGMEVMHSLRDLAYDRFFVPERYPSANDSRWATHWPGAGPGKTFMGYGYFCPAGWRRFSLKAPSGVDPARTFQDSVVMYHGLPPGNVTKIVRNGFIPHECQHGFKAVYLTPSIAYAAHPRYARVTRSAHGYFQVVLEVRVAREILQDSDRYVVVPETLCAGGVEVDPHIPNGRMEFVYKSPARFVTGSEGLVVTGVMVRRCLVDPLSLAEAQWWLQWPLKSKVKAKRVMTTGDQGGEDLGTREAAAKWLRRHYYDHVCPDGP